MFPDTIHKLVTALTSPFNLGSLGLVVVTCVWWLGVESRGLRVGRRILTILVLAWLWLWSTPLMTRWLGLSLERDFPPKLAEEMPMTDAICILGGGMGANTNICPYAEMNSSADRVWHGARLYKAGKAPKITLTGPNVRASTVPLLRDFGIPDSTFVFFERGHNTEDEAKMISSWLRPEQVTGQRSEVKLRDDSNARPKVLLVTSAWHMRRAKWLFEREGLEVIPAATDYEATLHFGRTASFSLGMLRPDIGCLFVNMAFWKEHFAYWCYRVVEVLR